MELKIATHNINDENLNLLTHHGFTFRRFNSTPEQNP